MKQMKQLVLNGLKIISILFALFIQIGCSSESSESTGSIVSNSLYTKWGISVSDVLKGMEQYQLESVDNDYVCCKGEKNVHKMSFLFDENGLCSSLLLFPKDKITLESLQSSVSGNYEYLGERGGTHILVNRVNNTMATISEKVQESEEYYALGYIVLNPD